MRRTSDYVYLDVYYYVLFSSNMRVRLGLRSDFVFGWTVDMHTYLYQFPLSLNATLLNIATMSTKQVNESRITSGKDIKME